MVVLRQQRGRHAACKRASQPRSACSARLVACSATALPRCAWLQPTQLHVKNFHNHIPKTMDRSMVRLSFGVGLRDRGVAALYSTKQTLAPSRAAPAAMHSHHNRLRVAVDVDEVLGQFVLALNQFCLHKYEMKHQVSDYWVYEFAKIWNCDQDRSNQIVHEFFKSSHFTQGIPVIPGAFQALQRMSKRCELIVVTSRQHVIQDQTLVWLDEHFPGTFKDVYFGNHWSLEGVSRKKSDICKAVGAGVLIDDNPSYAMECAQAGIHVLLYDWNAGYPWSKLNGRWHPLIRVVRDWAEVESALTELEPELLAKAAAAAVQGTGGSHGILQG